MYILLYMYMYLSFMRAVEDMILFIDKPAYEY